MAAINVRQIVGGPIFVKRHVAEQTRAGIASFKQIVTQDEIVGQSLIKAASECFNLVDALADERTFPEHILVHIGDRARIWIDAGLAAKQPRIS